MAKFDPNKHRKTKKRIAEVTTSNKSGAWEIKKPKSSDFIQIWGNSLDDLDEVNIFEQRDGAGKVKEWLIQGNDEEEEEKILDLLGRAKIKCAIVAPCIIRSNSQKFIWLAKQPGPRSTRVHAVHLRVREIIPHCQGKWQMVGWNEETKEYDHEEPKGVAQENMEPPAWPKEDKEITEAIGKAFDERIIDSVEHEIVKRTTGEIR